MTVKIDSTTDSEQAVTAALGGLAQEKVEETKAEEKSEAETEEVEAEAETESETEEESESKGDDESEEGENPKDGEKKPKKNGFKKRIEKLNKRLSERDRELEYWKAQATKPASQEPKPEPKKEAAASAKPKSEDFESHDAYIEAVADWKYEERRKAEEAKRKEEQVKADLQLKGKTHIERVKAFKAEHDDFDDLMEEVEDVPMSLAIQDAILDSENGPALMYELAKNREEYERICKLPAIAAARAIGKIEARIEKASQTKEEPKKTNAPPPISPVKAKSSSSTKSPDQMSYQEYKKYREKQLKKA